MSPNAGSALRASGSDSLGKLDPGVVSHKQSFGGTQNRTFKGPLHTPDQPVVPSQLFSEARRILE
ncbi:hypothetical protein PSP6_280105 [Paraburkholderia tropica]|nr:hypothetical protein PSP6_280105 [Paraburkholderia tropica]